MKLIQTQTLGTAQASIVLSDIPQTFTDLLVLLSDRSSRSAGGVNDGINFRLNDIASSGRRLFGSGSGVVTDTSPQPLDPSNLATANTYSNICFYVPNYASTTTNKSWSADAVSENNGTEAYQSLIAGLYASNTAVTSIVLTLNTGPNFMAGTTISIYGILKGSDGIVTTS